MLSYQNEIDKHIVESVARICDVGGTMVREPREIMELKVCLDLATEKGKEKVLINLTGAAANLKKNPLLTMQHIKNTIKLVKAKPAGSYGEVQRIEPEETNFFKTRKGMAALTRMKMFRTNNTVISYHDIERFGEQAIQKSLEELYPYGVVRVTPVEKDDIAERQTYFEEKSAWTYIPILPIVVLESGE